MSVVIILQASHAASVPPFTFSHLTYGRVPTKGSNPFVTRNLNINTRITITIIFVLKQA